MCKRVNIAITDTKISKTGQLYRCTDVKNSAVILAEQTICATSKRQEARKNIPSHH